MTEKKVLYVVQTAAMPLSPYKGDAEACPSKHIHSASFGYDILLLTSVISSANEDQKQQATLNITLALKMPTQNNRVNGFL